MPENELYEHLNASPRARWTTCFRTHGAWRSPVMGCLVGLVLFGFEEMGFWAWGWKKVKVMKVGSVMKLACRIWMDAPMCDFEGIMGYCRDPCNFILIFQQEEIGPNTTFFNLVNNIYAGVASLKTYNHSIFGSVHRNEAKIDGKTGRILEL